MGRAPKKIEVLTEVKDGNLITNRSSIKEAVKAFNGKEVKLVISRVYKERTSKENRYYWGVIIEHWKSIIREHWGEIWNKEDVHHFLKSNLNFEELIDESSGLILRKPKSTTENSTFEQEEFHEACRNLAWEMFEYQIPLPNEKIKAEY